jgi:hypothetical protein
MRAEMPKSNETDSQRGGRGPTRGVRRRQLAFHRGVCHMSILTVKTGGEPVAPKTIFCRNIRLAANSKRLHSMGKGNIAEE